MARAPIRTALMSSARAPVEFALRAVIAAAVLGGGGLLFAGAPRALRALGVFAVERVEVVGTRHLAPHEVLKASGIDRGSSLFDDPEAWRAALLEHPLIEAVDIERDLPGTIVVRVTEADPIALVRTPRLLPVDGAGRVLPIDPVHAALDLPILSVPSAVGSDGTLESTATLALLAALDRLRRLEPAFAKLISELQPAPDGGLRILLRKPARAEVLVPADVDAGRFRQLGLTAADLAVRGELGRLQRIDLRYDDQIVVALTPER